MLSIHYFASVREQVGKDSEQLPYSDATKTVDALMTILREQNTEFDSLMNGKNKLLIAVNQTVVERSYSLSEDDEIAFFPPMTGG